MKEQLIFSLLGGLIGYVGAMFQHRLESKRQRISDIRQEKMRVYSTVLTELGSLFMDPRELINEISNPDFHKTFALRLGRILAPARLIASDKLETCLKDLYEKEVDWHNSFDKKDEKEKKRLADLATTARMLVETEMRKELK